MIIDGEMAFGPHWTGRTWNPEDLIKMMDSNGIDKGLVTRSKLTVYPFPDNEKTRVINDYDHRLLKNCYINPLAFDDGGAEELRKYVCDHGFVAAKLNPMRHGYDVDNGVINPLMEAVEQLNIPIIIHSGSFFNYPWQIGNVAEEFPRANIIMNHMGFRYYEHSAIRIAKKYPNIYLEIAYVSIPGYIKKAVDVVGADRVIFATDFPAGHPKISMMVIECAGLSDHEKSMILGENLRKLLNI